MTGKQDIRDPEIENDLKNYFNLTTSTELPRAIQEMTVNTLRNRRRWMAPLLGGGMILVAAAAATVVAISTHNTTAVAPATHTTPTPAASALPTSTSPSAVPTTAPPSPSATSLAGSHIRLSGAATGDLTSLTVTCVSQSGAAGSPDRLIWANGTLAGTNYVISLNGDAHTIVGRVNQGSVGTGEEWDRGAQDPGAGSLEVARSAMLDADFGSLLNEHDNGATGTLRVTGELICP